MQAIFARWVILFSYSHEACPRPDRGAGNKKGGLPGGLLRFIEMLRSSKTETLDTQGHFLYTPTPTTREGNRSQVQRSGLNVGR